MAKILENIYLDSLEIRIGWTNDIENFNSTTFNILDLTTEQQLIISNFNNLMLNRLETSETLKDSLCQITVNQHYSEERIVWYINENEIVKFIIISSINNTEKNIYNEYKDMCISLLQN